MSPPAEKDEVSPSLAQLSLDSAKETPKQKAPQKKAKEIVADSWEDEELSESEPEEEKEDPAAQQPTITTTTTSSASDAPFDTTWSSPTESSSARTTEPGKRPEKTDAVARRMIVAGLGLKAPKLTDEQKAYQKSVREQEKRKRELEREAEQKRREDAEKAKAAMWDE